MLIECRGEPSTKSGWPKLTGGLNPVFLPMREKRQNAKPDRATVAKSDCSSFRFGLRSRIQDECSDDCKNLRSESEMQMPRVCRSRGQLLARVPGKQLEKVVYEATKLRPSGFAQQSGIKGGSAQRGTVDFFDEDLCSVDLPDTGARNGAGQVAPQLQQRTGAAAGTEPKGSGSSSPHMGQPCRSGLL